MIEPDIVHANMALFLAKNVDNAAAYFRLPRCRRSYGCTL